MIKDGVPHVMNPAEPMEPPAVYDLRELWRLESESEDGELVFGVIHGVAEDEAGNFYVLDSQLKTVHVVSRDGRYLRAIGREGEGPGELESPTKVFVRDDGIISVIDIDAGKLTFLTAEGCPAGELRAKLDGFDTTRIVSVCRIPHGYVLLVAALTFDERIMTKTDLIGVFSREGCLRAKVAEKTTTRVRGTPFVYDQEAVNAFRFLGATMSGSVLVLESYSEYRIDAYNLDGTKRMVIEREFEPVRRDGEKLSEEKHRLERYYRRRNPQIIVSDFERTVLGVTGRANGELWVTSSRSCKDLPKGIADIVDVFDSEGRWVEQAIMRKEISPEEDFIFYLEDRVFISLAGSGAYLAAMGGLQGTLYLSASGMRESLHCCVVK